MKIINLISGPRNISTALMYSFAQRRDTVVFDEPYYAIYLDKSGVDHPGRQEVLDAQSHDEAEVTRQITTSSAGVVFVKNMAHHMELLDRPIIPGSVNLFLIRNPHQIIASYAQVIHSPVMRDIGLEYQSKLFDKLQQQHEHVVVVDSNEILSSPGVVLSKVCEACNISFDSSMLQWESGPKSYDGVWAKYWYNNVHRSTGFEKQSTSDRALPDHLTQLYQQANRYYEKLLPFSVKA